MTARWAILPVLTLTALVARATPQSAQLPAGAGQRVADSVRSLINASVAAARGARGFSGPAETRRQEARAGSLANQALVYAKGKRNRVGEYEALLWISVLRSGHVRADSSLRLSREVVRAAKAAGDSNRIFVAESRLAGSYFDVGRLDSSRSIVARLIPWARSAHDTAKLADALDSMHLIELKESPGELPASGPEAFNLYSAIGDSDAARTVATSMEKGASSIAQNHLARGRPAEALPYFRAAVDWGYRSTVLDLPLEELDALASAYRAAAHRDSAYAVYRDALSRMLREHPDGSFRIVPLLDSLVAAEPGFAPLDTLIAHARMRVEAHSAFSSRGLSEPLGRLARLFDSASMRDSAEKYSIRLAHYAASQSDDSVAWRTYASLAIRFAETARPDSGIGFMRAALKFYDSELITKTRGKPDLESAFVRLARECVETSTMLLDLEEMNRLRRTTADSADLAFFRGVAKSLSAAADVLHLAGRGEVKLLTGIRRAEPTPAPDRAAETASLPRGLRVLGATAPVSDPECRLSPER
jgi:tetratricopeptide (TPR) repeat protein